MSEDAVWTPETNTPSARKGRGGRARFARITFSLTRGALALALVANAALIGVAVAGGYWLGQRARGGPESESVTPIEIPALHATRRTPSSRPVRPEMAEVAAPDMASGGDALLPSDAAQKASGAFGQAATTAPELEIALGGPSNTRAFGLQTGAYPSVEAARASLEPFREALAGLQVFIVPAEIKGRGLWHRVRIGVYGTRTAAEEARRALPAGLGEGAMIVSYR